MGEFIMIYVTVDDRGEAVRIAHALVEAKLAACVNVLGAATSVYRWQGKIEQAAETVMVAKTRRSLFEAAAAKIKDLHSYDTPCILAYPVADGSAPYVAWLADSTSVG